jgi:transcriptional regulator with XRE-family HTH domain
MDINEKSLFLIKDLAINLEKWKKSNGKSQTKLGQTARVAESTIRSIIKGTQNIEIATLIKLKLAFSVEISDLLHKHNKIPIIITSPLSLITIRKEIANEQRRIGENISKIMKEKNITPEELSIMAFNTDYSDTLKYLKGEINLTLITILKFAAALDVEIWKLLDNDKEIGKQK